MHALPMHTVDYYRWRLTDPETGRNSKTRHLMTAEVALSVDPLATPLLGSLERRLVPDGPYEFAMTDAWRRGT